MLRLYIDKKYIVFVQTLILLIFLNYFILPSTILTSLFDCEVSLTCVTGYLFNHWHKDWKQKSAEKALA